MAEPVRLVVWDLDETLWKGTLTEGGIEIIPANFALIRTLAERGVVTSNCSRNGHGAIERILCEAGIWDYFVLPSANLGARRRSSTQERSGRRFEEAQPREWES